MKPPTYLKSRITIRLDEDLLAWFRKKAGRGGDGYQSQINKALREYMTREPLEATLRRVVREELARSRSPSSPFEYGHEPSRVSLVADDTDSPYGSSLKRKRPRRR
jgi:BrnA antitoxin of type II toxin-antitoxin system